VKFWPCFWASVAAGVAVCILDRAIDAIWKGT